MGHEGDTKAFVGHDHGQHVQGVDGNVPTTEKQWRDMPKGNRPKVKPTESQPEPEPETQKATGIRACARSGTWRCCLLDQLLKV